MSRAASRIATVVIQPGADPDDIGLCYRGATNVTLDEEGRLQVSTPLGSFSDDAPYAYQMSASGQAEVDVAYRLVESDDDGQAHHHLGGGDHHRELAADVVGGDR